MGRRHVFIASLVWCGALGLTGCAQDSYGTRSETPTPAPTITDAQTCTDFGDVLTIVANADVALSEGRMQAQEHEGWYSLAARVLDRVPARGEGAVSDALTSLKALAPASAQGVGGTPALGTASWGSATQRLNVACADAGAELAVIAFTGG